MSALRDLQDKKGKITEAGLLDQGQQVAKRFKKINTKMV